MTSRPLRPLSRYACRIVCSRLPPFEVHIFAAGFNGERNIFLSETAPKWQEAETGWDALTTFGVRIWKPEVGAMMSSGRVCVSSGSPRLVCRL